MHEKVKSSVERLDHFDLAILRIVQKDNQLSNTAIGDMVGLTAPDVRSRLLELRGRGIIEKDVAILNMNEVGVTLIINITFDVDTAEAYEAFNAQMLALENVKQCYHVSGDTDYVLIVQGPTLAWFEEWSKTYLIPNKIIKRYDSCVSWSCKKFDTSISV